MRYFIQILLLVFISVTSLGQNPNRGIKSEKELYISLNADNKDSSSFIRHFKEYDESGKIISSIDYCPSSFGCSKSNFEFERKHQYKYDVHGNEILHLFYSKGSKKASVSTVIINTYDSLGLLIKKVSKKTHISESDTSDWGTHINTYEYDTNRNLVKKTDKIIHDFPRNWETLYKYDSLKRLIELIQPSEYMEIREKYTFDSNGNCTKYLMIGGPTSIHDIEKWEQQFDSQGNLLQRTETTYDGKKKVVVFSNNKNGLPVKISFQIDGIEIRSVEKKYNEYDDIIEIKYINSEGITEEKSRYMYEYY